jgi:hypothetical protein
MIIGNSPDYEQFVIIAKSLAIKQVRILTLRSRENHVRATEQASVTLRAMSDQAPARSAKILTPLWPSSVSPCFLCGKNLPGSPEIERPGPCRPDAADIRGNQ